MKCIVINNENQIINQIEAEPEYLTMHPEVCEISQEEERIYFVGQIYVGHVFSQAREKRAREFKAFDIYKSNIAYGIEIETQQKKEELMNWYQTWLDFPESINAENYRSLTFPATPESIKRYLYTKGV